MIRSGSGTLRLPLLEARALAAGREGAPPGLVERFPRLADFVRVEGQDKLF
ncbi:MAG TPA: hypothetical protein QF764_05400 [Planctomycetota bacterium]|nr:hypothetical protein [Planctomycetota bacterium]